MKPLNTHLIAALAAGDESTRLKAALAIGSNPEPDLVDTLVARCAIEPDFYVRDMLTWALTRLPPEITMPRLLAELRSKRAQARSQALHTLSKIKAPEHGPRSRDPCCVTPTTRSPAAHGVPLSPSCPTGRKRTWPRNWPCSSGAATGKCSSV